MLPGPAARAAGDVAAGAGGSGRARRCSTAPSPTGRCRSGCSASRSPSWPRRCARSRTTECDLDELEVTTCLRGGELVTDVRHRPGAEDAAEALRAGLEERLRQVHLHESRRVDRGGRLPSPGRSHDRRRRVRERRPAGRPPDAPPGVLESGSRAASSPTRTRPSRSCSASTPTLIEDHGAVSPEVAEAMADGALERFEADVACRDHRHRGTRRRQRGEAGRLRLLLREDAAGRCAGARSDPARQTATTCASAPWSSRSIWSATCSRAASRRDEGASRGTGGPRGRARLDRARGAARRSPPPAAAQSLGGGGASGHHRDPRRPASLPRVPWQRLPDGDLRGGAAQPRRHLDWSREGTDRRAPAGHAVHPRLHLRPARDARSFPVREPQRPRPDAPQHGRGRGRPARAAVGGRRSRPVRDGGRLDRWADRPPVREPLPGRGERAGAGRRDLRGDGGPDEARVSSPATTPTTCSRPRRTPAATRTSRRSTSTGASPR